MTAKCIVEYDFLAQRAMCSVHYGSCVEVGAHTVLC